MKLLRFNRIHNKTIISGTNKICLLNSLYQELKKIINKIRWLLNLIFLTCLSVRMTKLSPQTKLKFKLIQFEVLLLRFTSFNDNFNTKLLVQYVIIQTKTVRLIFSQQRFMKTTMVIQCFNNGIVIILDFGIFKSTQWYSWYTVYSNR